MQSYVQTEVKEYFYILVTVIDSISYFSEL